MAVFAEDRSEIFILDPQRVAMEFAQQLTGGSRATLTSRFALLLHGFDGKHPIPELFQSIEQLIDQSRDERAFPLSTGTVQHDTGVVAASQFGEQLLLLASTTDETGLQSWNTTP